MTRIAEAMSNFKRQMRRRKQREAKERRVVLKRLPERDRFGTRTTVGTCTPATIALWANAVKGAGLWETTHPVVRLTEHGIDYGIKPQPGDEVGYGMDPYRHDDCLQAAVATATQTPIEQVPDLKIDRRLKQGEEPDEISRSSWERLDRWASELGLTLMFFEPHELPAPRRRWVGVITSHTMRVEPRESGEVIRHEDERGFNDHCLVMSHERLIFDPSCSVEVPPGMRLLEYHPNQITYGISFDNKE